MSALMVIVIIFGVMAVFGMGTCLVCVAVAGKTASSVSPVPSVPSPHDEFVAAEARAMAACQSMMSAGVATDCKANDAPLRERLDWAVVRFKPVGMFPDDTGDISCFRNDDAYTKGVIVDTDTAPDDYPNLTVTSPKSRLQITLSTDAASTNAKSNDCIQKHMNLPVHDRLKACSKEINYEGKWPECMEKKKTVAACAKTYPTQYAKAHAWYDAAKRAVEQ